MYVLKKLRETLILTSIRIMRMSSNNPKVMMN